MVDIREEEKDGGWGWACMIGCFFMHILVVGIERSFGMMYTDIVEKYAETAAAVAGVGAVASALRLGLAPVGSLVSNRLSPRIAVMGGAVLVFIGAISTAFAPTFMFLYFSWGVLVGTGTAMMYTPSFIVLATYFRRRLPLANGVSASGSGVGLLIFPPLYTFIVHKFGFSWSIMIIGAIALNGINCGALYRPKRELTAVVQDESTPMTGEEKVSNEVKEKPRKHKSLDFKLFLHFQFDLYILSTGVTALACIPVMTFLPARIIEQGYTKAEAAVTLSILGIPDTIGRIIAGVIFSYVPWLCANRKEVYVILLFLIAVTLTCLPSATTLSVYYVVVTLYGFFMGMTVALNATLLSDWIRHVDPHGDTASGLGFMTGARGLGTVLGPIVGGLLVDLTGEYTYTFYFLSAMMLFSALTYLLLNIFDRFVSRRTSQDDHDVHDVQEL